jgi:deoxycytidylate deaminase
MNMSKGIDLSHIYRLRNKFTIIGLTGQIGSGCSEVAEQLVKGFNRKDFEDPYKIGLDKENEVFKHNSFRNYRIIYNYASINFKSYARINYKYVLVLFLLNYSFGDFINFLESNEGLSLALEDLFKKLKTSGGEPNFDIEISELKTLKESFDLLSEKYKKINFQSIDLYEFYFTSDFQPFCEKFLAALKKNSRIKRNKLFQIISLNLRKTGDPYKFSDPIADKAFTIVGVINEIIISHEKFMKAMSNQGQNKEERTQIVIDDLRNPVEIMFFRQRYASYYTVAINRDDDSREIARSNKYSTPDTREIREAFWKEEYKGGEDDEFFKANISACIQQADIHISFLSKDEVDKENRRLEKQTSDLTIAEREVRDNTSPSFMWREQLLKYVTLISHPGLIPPSPEERCMQMAYTAKHNSGCISRHVGAAVTDKNYSIKAVGWNTTPEGLVPCVLRDAQDLINPQINSDKKAFTPYEWEYVREDKYGSETGPKFRNECIDKFEKPIEENIEILKGRNVCFCFKDIRNSFSKDGKNQVHTRSLHAEENAFLQLAKYGGNGIQNGKLFTTASPCELCAKKAVQLGINVIYYIDPYPGISMQQILSACSNEIKVRLFNGAIGNAYHWLYDPMMPYKDELTLLLDNKFYDYATQQEKKANDFEIKAFKYKEDSEKKDIKIAELEQKILNNEKIINENNPQVC